jgi:ATP-dependent DNA helicase RecG
MILTELKTQIALSQDSRRLVKLKDSGISSSKSSGKSSEQEESSQKGSLKSSQKIMELMQGDLSITIGDLARNAGITDRTIEKQIEKLKAIGRIRRIGPDKGGHWEVVK